MLVTLLVSDGCLALSVLLTWYGKIAFKAGSLMNFAFLSQSQFKVTLSRSVS